MEILNPLSFSQNATLSIGEMTRNALAELGVPKSYYHNIDLLSPVQIVFKGNICINISIENDRLWFWSFFSVEKNQIIKNIENVYNILNQPMGYAETDRVILSERETGYELKALINPHSASDAKLFSEAIGFFYKTSSTFSKLTSI
ncbi:type III secretion system chaperone family protein [Yersinia intermedia]|uniref:hypothetical protein n=1 Tax=Yersinia intermedia TaxID=631 RepID=UPI0011A7AB88|nr:hypothetical protein [Yersinia intermedia]